MKKQTFGSMIAEFRKKKGMTQVELAEKMGVTDKAVSITAPRVLKTVTKTAT